MRDNIRNWTALLAVAMTAFAATPVRHPCDVDHATLGETLSTPELSTEQMEVALARDKPKTFVIDARPYAEYAISHIPGAWNASDVEGIRQLLGGSVDAVIVLYCDGPFCDTTRRLAEKLKDSGFTHIVRYQLGIAVWRALGHPTQSEPGAFLLTLTQDRTAVVIDARDAASFAKGSLPGARNVRFDEITKAKDDGRLPMLDHNTRIFVVGKDAREARTDAEEIAKNAFQNVSFYAGDVDSLRGSR